MSLPQTGLSRVCRLLNHEEARYVVVGATAMQLWGTSRSTGGIDIPIEPTANAERVLRALGARPFGVAQDIDPTELISRPVTMIGDTPNVDVLTRAWNLQWKEAEQGLAVFDIEGVAVPTVTCESHRVEADRATAGCGGCSTVKELRQLRRKDG